MGGFTVGPSVALPYPVNYGAASTLLHRLCRLQQFNPGMVARAYRAGSAKIAGTSILIEVNRDFVCGQISALVLAEERFRKLHLA